MNDKDNCAIVKHGRKKIKEKRCRADAGFVVYVKKEERVAALQKDR